jgi:hypothetical protein
MNPTEEIFMSADEPPAPQALASKANGSTPPAVVADVPAEAPVLEWSAPFLIEIVDPFERFVIRQDIAEAEEPRDPTVPPGPGWKLVEEPTTTADWAARYAALGLPVFAAWGVVQRPDGTFVCRCGKAGCTNPGKHPFSRLAPNGFKDATVDQEKARNWFTNYPDAGLAIATGNVIVIDIDPRNGGDVSLRELEQQHGALPRTWRCATGGGGWHVFFSPPAGIEFKAELAPGIDIKGNGGYVLAAPSLHFSGKRYEWDVAPGDVPLAPMPAWVIELGRKGSRSEAVSNGSTDPFAAYVASEKRMAIAKVRRALAIIPGDAGEGDFKRWNDVGMAIWAATGGSADGLAAFDAWSQKSPAYDKAAVIEKWKKYFTSPPTEIGAGSLRHWASEIDPNWSEVAVAQATAELPKAVPQPVPAPKPHMSLDELHTVFRRWLGEHYDIDTIDATLATAAGEKLGGDPCWLLIISGPGNAKTETVQALSGCGAHITSTIQSEGALLSASSKKDRTKTATGGLLRKIGDRGVLVIKDVTSILSSDRTTRGPVLAAIREIYDGRWERNVGSDGGQTITWTGRIAVIGACTTAWDSAHAVIAACGDRFVVIRSDSEVGRQQSGLQAMRNVSSETQMRAELADAVGRVIYHANTEGTMLTDAEMDQIMKAADITTFARTAVEFDYSGEVIDSHAPEMPTRFAKQLAQLFRGCVSLGMTRDRAMQLVIRCARDSVPPLRLSILLDLAERPDSRPGEVRARIGKPWRTTKRAMEALTMIGLLACDERADEGKGVDDEKRKTIWSYRLSSTLDRETLLAMAGQTTPAACQEMATEVKRRVEAALHLSPAHEAALDAIERRMRAGEQLSLSEERLWSAAQRPEF